MNVMDAIGRRWRSVIPLLLLCLPGVGCDGFLGFELGGLLAEQALTSDRSTDGAQGETGCAPTSNRCGPPGLGFIVPDCPLGVVCFFPACNDHDVCYSTCGASRSDCDRDFCDDLLSICSAEVLLEPRDADRCLALAYIYCQTSVRLGQEPFDNAQTYACNCGQPNVQPAARPRRQHAPTSFNPPFADEDDDLMPDRWEERMGFDSAEPADAVADSDHDGLSNLGEFVLGTDPSDASSGRNANGTTGGDFDGQSQSGTNGRR